MNTIPARDAAFLLAALMVMLTIVGSISLWSRRSPAVHWWWISNVVGAVSVVLQGDGQVTHTLSAGIEFPLIATVGVGAVALKLLSLHYLITGIGAERTVAQGLLLNLAVALGLAGLGVDRWVFSAYVGAAMVLGEIAAVVQVHRLARRERSRSARLLSIALGIPTLLALLLLAFLVPTGRDVLAISSEPVGLAYLLPSIATAAANTVLFIGVVLEMAERERTATEAALAQERLDRLRLQERARLVADLHDGFGSQLTSARLQAERQQLSPSEMCIILDECLADLHLVVDTVDNIEGDLGDSLRYLRHRLASRLADGPVVLHWSVQTEGAPTLPPDRLLQLLRILQEAISNALRHAGAREIHVAAEYDAARQEVHCRVTDDGQGFVPGEGEGAGLRNMRGRAARLGGTLEVRPTPQGTTVALTVPLGGPSVPATPS